MSLYVERMLCSPFIITYSLKTETLRAKCLAEPSYSTWKTATSLAANIDDESLAAEEFIPEADELPEMGRVPTLPPEPVPWGGSLFEWDSGDAKRALRLIKLGHGEYASSLVKGLKPIPGYTDTEITYARSLLQQSLGAYNVAFQLVVRQFGQTLKKRSHLKPCLSFAWLILQPSNRWSNVNATRSVWTLRSSGPL